MLTVDLTATPGPGRSTWLFFWEKPATARLESIAATETTESYDAG